MDTPIYKCDASETKAFESIVINPLPFIIAFLDLYKYKY